MQAQIYVPQPPQAFTCPSCGAPCGPQLALQKCGRCGAEMWLRAGRMTDPSTQMPVFEQWVPTIRVKSAGAFLLKQGELSPYGVSEGTLDPITGMIPMEQSGVGFGDIHSIAIYRKVDVMRIIATTILAGPLSFFFIMIAVNTHTPIFFAFAAPILALALFMLHRAIIVRAHYARIVGSMRTIVVRFDRPMWKRRQFCDELFRRAGIANPPRLP